MALCSGFWRRASTGDLCPAPPPPLRAGCAGNTYRRDGRGRVRLRAAHHANPWPRRAGGVQESSRRASGARLGCAHRSFRAVGGAVAGGWTHERAARVGGGSGAPCLSTVGTSSGMCTIPSGRSSSTCATSASRGLRREPARRSRSRSAFTWQGIATLVLPCTA